VRFAYSKDNNRAQWNVQCTNYLSVLVAAVYLTS